MSLSSGAYFDSQSIARGKLGPRGFADMDGAVVEHEDDGFVGAARAWPVDRVESRAPIIARLRDCPGASTRKSQPRLAQARAR